MRTPIVWKMLLFATALITGGLFSLKPSPLSAEHRVSPDEDYALTGGFEPNHGQTDSQVRFLSRGKGYRLFLTDAEAVVSMQSSERVRPPLILRMRPAAGANPAPRLVGDSELSGKANYVRHKEALSALENVPTYARVRYEDVYPDIDLVFHDNGRELEYDFVVAPGADPDRIRLEFTGADELTVNAEGELVLHTAAGELRQPAPVVYQERDGVRSPISGGYVLAGAGGVSFRVGEYDHARPLVIDPVLAYSTYFGGASDEIGWDVAVDAGGNAYVTGARPSVSTPDAYDYDIYVAKFSSSGALLWVTDLGDHCDDQGRGITLDATGNVYVTGQLGTCYPIPELNAGAFVAKLTPTGGSSYMFPFSDYWYGGVDLGQAVAVDSGGRAHVTGITSSEQFPTTPGAFQEYFSGGIGDGFVVKVNATGSALLWATYLGGAEWESPNDIALDANGSVYVAGSAVSTDFPTHNGYQTVHPGLAGCESGFVTKLTPDGSALVYSTFLGGGPEDVIQGIAVDSLGNAYVTGSTESSAFPVTPGVVQPNPGDDRFCYYRLCTDAFVTKLNPTGTALVYSTYLGGDLFDDGVGIAVDSAGNAYVTGSTLSFTFPTLDAFQPNSAGQGDAFVTKLNATGSAILYSSYLGGSQVSETALEGEDGGIRIAVEPATGNAYVIGLTRSPNFPVTNAHQPNFGGGLCGVSGYRCGDAFLTKIGVSCTFSISPTSQAVAAAGGTGTVSVTASSGTCARTATSAVPWITITSGGNGTGSGNVGYSVAANPSTAPRTGTLSIAGRTFTVNQAAASALSVTVASPNGGEKLFTGTPYTISWTSSGASSFDVATSVDNGATYSPVAGCTGLPGTSRSCVWAAPGPVTSTARIRVTAHGAAGSLSDASNAAFSILSGTASVTVTFPNTSVNLGIGSMQVIKWSHNLGTQSYVKIELSRDVGLTFPETLVAAHRNTSATSGNYNWRVTGPSTAGAQARIRVSWTSGPASDVSNASFIIAPVFISVSLPATGASWGVDTTQKQTWTTNLGALDRVNVQLSTAGIAGPFTTMSGGGNIVATLKQAQVVVPATATTTARVKVVWANPPATFSASGTNPGNFKIEPPFVRLTAPVAGEVWPIGSAKTIRWASNLGVLEAVEIRLSKDGGATYPILIADRTASDGSHPVTVGASWGSQSVTRIKIGWLKAASVSGVSSNFTIQP